MGGVNEALGNMGKIRRYEEGEGDRVILMCRV